MRPSSVVIALLLTLPALADRPPRSRSLHDAAAANDLDAVNALLAAGSNPNDVTGKETPLVAAARRGHLDVARTLLKKGAEPDFRRAPQDTRAVLAAADAGKVEMVELLVHAGADPKAPSGLYGLTPLYAASRWGHLDVVKVLIARQVPLNDQSAKVYADAGYAPLHAAVDGKHAGVVIALLRAGANPNVVTARGETPLIMAINERSEECVRALLNANADITPSSRDGHTSVYWAANNGMLEVTRSLLAKGASASEVGTDGHTPLMAAAHGGHTGVVRLLLESGAEPNLREPRWGETPLMRAANNQHLETVKALVAAGATVDGASTEGMTPLMFAARNGASGVVGYLLEKGADVSAREKSGRTALELAAKGGHHGTVKLLEEKGAPKTSQAAAELNDMSQRRYFPDRALEKCGMHQPVRGKNREFCVISDPVDAHARRFHVTARDPSRLEQKKSVHESNHVLIAAMNLETSPGEYADYERAAIHGVPGNALLLFVPIVVGQPDKHGAARSVILVFDGKHEKFRKVWDSPVCGPVCTEQQLTLSFRKDSPDRTVEIVQTAGGQPRVSTLTWDGRTLR